MIAMVRGSPASTGARRRHLGLPHRHQRQPRRNAPPAAAAASPVARRRPRRRTSPPTTTPAGTSTARRPRVARGRARSRCPRTSACRWCSATSGDLDYAEIAEVLDVPVGTVKSRIARGRAMLAAALRTTREPRHLPATSNRGTMTDDRTPANPPTSTSGQRLRRRRAHAAERGPSGAVRRSSALVASFGSGRARRRPPGRRRRPRHRHRRCPGRVRRTARRARRGRRRRCCPHAPPRPRHDLARRRRWPHGLIGRRRRGRGWVVGVGVGNIDSRQQRRLATIGREGGRCRAPHSDDRGR